MGRRLEGLREEIRHLLPPAIFFLFALHFVALLRVLMLKGTGIPLQSSASVTLAALVIAKAVLLADMLPFINRYPHKPLIYNIAWKTILYWIVALLVNYLERLFEFSRAAGGIAAGSARLQAQIVWPHFWAIQLFLFVLILMYCTLRELVRVLGRPTMVRIFFGPVPGRSSGATGP